MKTKRRIIHIDEKLCDGCGQCILACSEGALKLAGGKARVVSDRLCDGIGDCIGGCPQGALRIVEREAEEFDAAFSDQAAHACPFSSGPAQQPDLNWPVKLRLVQPQAPFLRKAELVIAADCSACMHRSFHDSFVSGKALLSGCPKFDGQEVFSQKLSMIFGTADIRSLVSIVMDVPCCAVMQRFIGDALRAAGRKIPWEQVVTGLQGDIVSRNSRAA